MNKEEKISKKTVVLALSGGIDSSYCAYLLKNMGFNVICVFIKCWDSSLNSENIGKPFNKYLGCDYIQEYKNAKLVADSLGLNLFIFDFVEEYWNLVFKHFLYNIKNGYTPNPDVYCNSIIKFNLFVKKSIKLYNPDYIATGHYAKIEKIKNHLFLTQAEDKSKDQTYFLSNLNESQLNKLIFPLADFYKKEVKQNLKRVKINMNFTQKSSSGICFIGKRNFKKFLTNYFPIKKGRIIDIKTNEILKEKHDGYYFYTVGQRKGLNLGGYPTKHFIVKKNVKKNILYVANVTDTEFLKSKAFYAKNMHFINNDFFLKNQKLIKNKFEAMLRYQAKKINVTIDLYNHKSKKIKVIFKTPQISVTPGQFCVFFDKNICVGNCIVDNIIHI